MSRKFLLYTLGIGLVIAGCKGKTAEEKISPLVADVVDNQTTIAPEPSTIKEWLQHTLEPLIKDSASTISTAAEPVLFAAKPIYEVYGKNRFEPIWVNETGLNKRGEELINILSATEQYGLEKNYYGFPNIVDALKALQNKEEKPELIDDIELSLTNAWLLLALHLHEGAVGKGQLLNHDFSRQAAAYADALLKSVESDGLRKDLEAFQPQHIHYRKLQKALVGLSKQKNQLPKGFSIPDHKTDSAACAAQVIRALTYQGYLDSSGVTPQTYLVSLKKFQQDHGLEADGVPGKNTRSLLLLDNQERYKRVAINIDRWRAQDHKFPGEYVLVNIPAFELYWMEGDKVNRTHKIVVGKPGSRTPDLSSAINLVVVNPDWTVPQSIIRNELRNKSASYLSRYQIYQNGNRVSPGQVNWRAGGIRVVQPPGPTNALGFIKFMFPNSHSVYLHDTPSRNLFANSVRAYSHGCVRVENPLDFGLALLNRDGQNYTMDSLQAMIKGGTLTNIKLRKTMPIFIQYHTADVSEENRLRLYPDLYKREDEQAAVLFYGRYDKTVDPNRGRKAIPSIDARPDAIAVEDTILLGITP